MARGAQSGCIHLHQHNTDDVSKLIHADIAITAKHAEEINSTTKKEMDDKTRKEYSNRISNLHWVTINILGASWLYSTQMMSCSAFYHHIGRIQQILLLF